LYRGKLTGRGGGGKSTRRWIKILVRRNTRGHGFRQERLVRRGKSRTIPRRNNSDW